MYSMNPSSISSSDSQQLGCFSSARMHAARNLKAYIHPDKYNTMHGCRLFEMLCINFTLVIAIINVVFRALRCFVECFVKANVFDKESEKMPHLRLIALRLDRSSRYLSGLPLDLGWCV